MENTTFDQKMERLTKDILTHFREYCRLSQGTAASPKAAEISVAEAPLTDEMRARRDTLKAWRSAEARAQNIAAFLICSNRTLRELAEKSPRTNEQLAEIHGMGTKKIEKYGKAILQVIASNEQTNPPGE